MGRKAMEIFMKAYIITVTGATLLSAAAGIFAPEKWRGYVQLITGLVIISCIVSPITHIVKSDIFSGFDNIDERIELGTQNQAETVISELEKRINGDIKARMKDEFNLSVEAQCEIRLNDNEEITGVESVQIYGDKLTDRARNRICEVYGLKPYEVHG